MQLHIVLEEDDGAEQANKAVVAIGIFLGNSVMTQVAGMLAHKAQMMTGTAPITPAVEGEAEVPSDGTGLDAEGLPWDARIHSSSKAKTQKGVWKFARNLDENIKMQVLSELRGKTTPAQSVPPPPPPGAAPPPPAQMEIPAALDRRPPPPPAAAPAPAVDAQAITFPQLMQKFSGLLMENKITKDQLNEACKTVGLDTPAALGAPQNAVHIPAVSAYVDALVMMG